MTQIKPVYTMAEIGALASLAQTIWTEYFTPIIGAGQVAYMLAKFQSPTAIQGQLAEGYQYFGVYQAAALAGYFAIKPQADKQMLFLSKFYLAKDFRGQGLARMMLQQIDQLCRHYRLPVIRLTVNKGNNATIAIYERLGFATVTSQVAEIGGGYVMDDWIMERPCPVLV